MGHCATVFQKHHLGFFLALFSAIIILANCQLEPPTLQKNLDSDLSQDLGQNPRVPKQLGLFEWLFGPPVIAKNHTHLSNESVTSDSHLPIHHQIFRTKSQTHKNETETLMPLKNLTSEISFPNISNFNNPEENLSYGPIFAKPRVDHIDRSNHSRQIEITDIQHSVGTEINDNVNLDSDPSQVNLQQELEAIDKLEKNVSLYGTRKKRQSSNKFRQLNIPYGGGDSNNRINTLSKRQLFLTPVDQQMLALRQQQDLMTATMLQQQQLLNRYNNRYVDDYYDDDDSSYEDSYERFEDFNRLGMRNPLAEAMRRGIIPPIPAIPPHPMGIGRRSLPDEAPPPPRNKKNKRSQAESQKTGDASILGPISKDGRWEMIEDYDLTSHSNKFQSRVGKPSASNFEDFSKEMDESEEDELEVSNRGRNDLARQGDSNTTTTASSTAPTEASPASNSENPTTASSGSPTTLASSESPASTNESSTTTSSGNSTAAPSGSSTTPATSNGTSTAAPSGSSTTPATSNGTSTVAPEGSSSTTESSTGSSSEDPGSSTTASPSSTTPASSSNSTTVSTTPSPSNSSTTTKKPSTTESPKLPPFHQTLNCRCGVQSVRGENVDGTIIRTMVNPWLVSIGTKQKHLCSGSIINNKYILTSKQCVKGVKTLIVTAGMGSRSGKNFTVVSVNPHKTRDIALLKIKPPITPNQAMRPVCLPIRNKNKEKERDSFTTGILVTFKRSSPKSNSLLQLVQTEVPILSESKCSNDGERNVPERSLCPAPPASMKCGGDTGGLLQVYQRGYSYEQVGVVSSTVGCRANKTSGIYTDLRKSVKWILYNTKDARYCRKPKISPEDLTNAQRISEVESTNTQTKSHHDDDEFESDEEEAESSVEEDEWGRILNA